MIAEAGLAALWLAAALSLLGLFLSVVHVRGKLDADRAVRALAIVQGVLCLFAFAMLLVVFASTDLSVALVAENSHSAKPFIYKIAGAWGNHEGSMLLWVTVLGLSGTALAAFSRQLPSRTLIAALGAQAALALGFHAFLLFASNPVRPARPAGAARAGGSTRCCRTPASPSIRRRSTSAMSGFRSRSAWPSARCWPATSTGSSRERCVHGSSAPGSS